MEGPQVSSSGQSEVIDMAQTPLLVAIDFGALVEEELRAEAKSRRKGKRKHPLKSGEHASHPGPRSLLSKLKSLSNARMAQVQVYRAAMLCGVPLAAGIDSDD